MKVSIKFIAAVIGIIILLIGLDGYLSIQREIQLFKEDAKREARVFANAMKALIADSWQVNGEDRALELIADINHAEKDIRIRWVWLDDSAPPHHRPEAPLIQVKEQMARSTDVAHFSELSAGNWSYTYVPVETDGERQGALELAIPLKKAADFAHRTTIRTLVLATAVIAAGALVASLLGMIMIARPLHLVTAKIRRIAAGTPGPPLALNRHDEIGELARGVDTMQQDLEEARARLKAEMAARIDALEKLRHKDRLETIGSLASGIAHELGTPLNVVLGRAGLIAKKKLPEDQEIACAEVIRKQCERMRKIIERLLDFARRKPPAKNEENLNRVLRHVIELLEPMAKKNNVALDVHPYREAVPLIQADKTQIEQVLMNLVVNAIQAMPDGGTVAISVHAETRRRPGSEGQHDKPEQSFWRVDVQDSGEGVDPQNLEHLFEPFFSTKFAGEGTGLGLSISWEIIHEHNGWIDVRSQPGKGACFSVHMPMEAGA
jgi:two-component system NtrC family sensor kinase